MSHVKNPGAMSVCLTFCIPMSNGVKKGPVEQLADRLSQLESSAKASQQELLRAMADFENFRRRVERDVQQHQRAALERLLVDLLPVLDDFERALRHIVDCKANEAVERGISLIQRQLCDTLAKHGLNSYSMRGQQFDPRRAEAIGFVHSDEYEPNTVVEEACRGYECQGKVIRPARVVVAKPRKATDRSEVAGKQEDSETANAGEVV